MPFDKGQRSEEVKDEDLKEEDLKDLKVEEEMKVGEGSIQDLVVA